MKKQWNFIVMALVMLLQTIALPANGTYSRGDGNDEDQSIILIRQDNKRTPSNVFILFSYNKGSETVTFTLPEGISSFTILMEEMGGETVYTGQVVAETPQWHQALAAGTYQVRCVADEGSEFAGTVIIE